MNAKEIKAIRTQLRITQEEMARRLKCTARTISRLENEKSRPTKAMIRRLNRQAENI
jgi:transcriptional regulator with XRE-family HTH domain